MFVHMASHIGINHTWEEVPCKHLLTTTMTSGYPYTTSRRCAPMGVATFDRIGWQPSRLWRDFGDAVCYIAPGNIFCSFAVIPDIPTFHANGSGVPARRDHLRE